MTAPPTRGAGGSTVSAALFGALAACLLVLTALLPTRSAPLLGRELGARVARSLAADQPALWAPTPAHEGSRATPGEAGDPRDPVLRGGVGVEVARALAGSRPGERHAGLPCAVPPPPAAPLVILFRGDDAAPPSTPPPHEHASATRGVHVPRGPPAIRTS